VPPLCCSLFAMLYLSPDYIVPKSNCRFVPSIVPMFVKLLFCPSKAPPNCGDVSSTILSIAFGLAVELVAIVSSLVPSTETSLPSTVKDCVSKFPPNCGVLS